MTHEREVPMVSAAQDTDRRLRSRSVVAGALFAALVAASGCSSGNPNLVGSGNNNNPPGGAEAGAGSCLRDEPGCACAHEGAVIQCGVAAYDDGGEKGTVKCAMGGEICSGGRWSACETNSNDPALKSASGLKLVTGVTTKALTNPGISCTNNPCDPYCMQYPDNANGLNPGDAGVSTLGCGDASVLTVVTTGNPDATTAPPAILKDAALADGEGVIFIDLPTGQTATRSFITPAATIKNADIYFLIDDGSNMGAAASNLANSLTGSSGIIQELRALLASGTNFGVGRFEDYFWAPYVAYGSSEQASEPAYNSPFENLLSIQSDTGANANFTAHAVDWMTVDAFLTLTPASQYFQRSGGDIPESSVSALWATATGNGLFTGLGSPGGDGVLNITGANNANSGGQSWYTTPRQAWNGTSYVPYWPGSPLGFSSYDTTTTPVGSTYLGPTSEQQGGALVPCNLATTIPSYPCFRQSSTPVVVMMSSAPSHNGPGGQYPYVETPYASYSPPLAGANSWPIQPVAGCTGALANYGGPVAGAGSMCQLLHDPATTTNVGKTFATAIPLPVSTGGTPLPGVYYGVVPNGDRSSGDIGGADWFSGSSVGGGVISFPTPVAAGAISKWSPGAPQRSSLRDCSATDHTQCVPSITAGTTYPTDCYNNTSTAASTVTAAATAASNSQYTPTGTPIASAPATLYTHASLTEVATTNTLGTATASGGPTALTTIASTTHATTAVTIPTANPSPTVTADSYSAGPTITLAATNPPYKVPVTSGTYTIPGSITIPAGDELANVTVTVNAVVAGYTAVISAAASVGGIATGTVSAPPSGGSSTASGVYYAGTTAVSGVTFSVTQNASSSYSTPIIGGVPTNYVEVTITYQLNTPNACPTGTYNEPITYGTAGTSATAQCPVCPTGFPYTGGVCAGPQCAGGTTQGTGSNGSVTTKCYSCPSGGTLNTGVSPWACTNTCTSGTIGTGSNTGSCYSCSAGTLGNLSSSPPTCSYACTTGTIGASPESTSSCYSCPTGSTLVKTTNPWTCTNTCAGTGWTLGTGTNSSTGTCYTCTGVTNGVGNTNLVLDTQSNPWNCASCPTTLSTPTAGPALDALITSTNPYTCDGCPSTAYTLNAAGSQCTPTTLTCSSGYTLTGGKCVAASACTNAGSGATESSTSPGVGCDGLGALCPTPASSTTATCYTKVQTSSATPPGTCTCAKTTYTAGTSTTATCLTGAATAPNLLAASNSCSTGGNGNTCVVATGAACTAYSANTGSGGISCQVPAVGPAPQCTSDALPAGDGYYGNDQIFSFTVPAGNGFGSRYYYHFALLREPAYLPPSGSSSVPGNWVTGAAPGTTGTVLANAAGGYTPKPFLYLKSAGGFSVNPVPAAPTDTSYPYSILSAQGASDTLLPYAGPNGPVLDCNISALVSDGVNTQPVNSTFPSGSDYILSEIDGYLPAESSPTTYYLVVDNAGPSAYTSSLPTFQYFLQVGGFDDAPSNTSVPTYTAPSYGQMVTALNGIQAKFVGVDNSGISCFQPGDSFTQDNAQYDTRDFMEKVAYDVGSYDSTTTPVRPYVVPVRPDGTSCNATCPAALAAQAAGGTCTGTCLATCAAWGATTCLTQYPLSPIYDASTQACTRTCSTNGDCPMNTPVCQSGAPNYCTTTCPGGVSGLSCAVASAVTSLTNNLKQDVYLRPISVNAGSTYSPPGATCTPTVAGAPASAQCTGTSTGGTDCYGGSCTTTCLVATDCASGLCEASTYPGDTNKYCISPAVFVQSVHAHSTSTATTGSQTVCGIHPKTLPCAIDANCPTSLPTCLTSGPAVSTCGINDTGPDTIVPLPSYYEASTPPQDNDGMFNYCSPGSTVQFDVTFIMPFQRSENAQQYEFDLGIYAGAGIIGRTRVILENPALAVSDFYRDYDGNVVCPGGTHVVWGNFSYNALCPSDGVGDYSQIRFCATSSTSADAGFRQLPSSAQDGSGGCAPGEVLLGIATANHSPTYATSLDTINTCPANGNPAMGYPCAPKTPATATAATWTTCNALTTTPTCNANSACNWAPQLGFNVGTVLAANGVANDAGLASDQYLRIRMEFDPSTPGDVVAPFLYSWNLNVDCIPSE